MSDSDIQVLVAFARQLAAATSPNEVCVALSAAIRESLRTETLFIHLSDPHSSLRHTFRLPQSDSSEQPSPVAPDGAIPLSCGGEEIGFLYLPGVDSADDLQLARALGSLACDAFVRVAGHSQPIDSPEALEQQNRLLRSLIDALPDYLYVKDLDGRFLIANAALARSFGLSNPAEVIGKTDSDFAPPHLQAKYRADELAVMDSGQPMIDREEIVEEASGTRVLVHTTKVPLKDESSHVMGIVGVGHAPQSVDEVQSPDTFRRGTLAEAARRARVSIATVSRAFNGSPLVTEETRQRVFAAAREVGYAPNVAARNLSKGRTETVALVLQPPHLRGEFYTQLLSSFHWSLRQRGLNVLLSVVPEQTDPLVHIQQLIASGACGAMAVHFQILQNADAETLRTIPIPMVVVNYSPNGRDAFTNSVTVGFDDAGGVKQAVRHLVALGHTSIAFLGGTPGLQTSHERERGFREAMAESLLDTNESWIVPCSYEAQTSDGSGGLHQVYANSTQRPTAVVCAADTIAATAILDARTWGQQVPRDLSVVGFDDLSWACLYSPPLTTVRHSGQDLGLAAGQSLISLLDRRVPQMDRIVLPTRLVVRASTAPPVPEHA